MISNDSGVVEFETIVYKIIPYSFNYNFTLMQNITEERLENCAQPTSTAFNTSFGIIISVPEWEAIATAVLLTVIIIATVFGNLLVILGVFTHKPLRIVQNFFIVSLAVADIAVAVLVMPFNVTYSILGRWEWGIHLCKMWLTCDIMCCTSSILNLCAIALDRYWAITDPIDYANKRTLKRVMVLIAGVWILSLIISSPPLLGWNDWPDKFTSETPCRLTSERGYIIYSSFGSFFIPLFIMTIVYIKIYTATKQRLRRRAMASRINITQPQKNDIREVHELESANSDSNVNDDNDSDSSQTRKRSPRKDFNEVKKNLFMPLILLNEQLARKRMESEMSLPVATDSTTCSARSSPARVLTAFRTPSLKRNKDKPLVASVNTKGTIVHQFIEEKQKISLSKERRAARTLGIIMGVFVVCWLPFFLMYVILPFCYSCCPQEKLINFITWLGYINSTVNPLIYTIFNVDFRKAFKKLLGLKN